MLDPKLLIEAQTYVDPKITGCNALCYEGSGFWVASFTAGDHNDRYDLLVSYQADLESDPADRWQLIGNGVAATLPTYDGDWGEPLKLVVNENYDQ